MKKIVMYPHGGSDNHGCEAIVKTTIDIMNQTLIGIENSKLISSAPQQDIAQGIDEICEIKNHIRHLDKFSIDYLKCFVNKNVLGKSDAFDNYSFSNIYGDADEKTLALSIGGDNYCYGVPYHILFVNRKLRERKVKNVLWGCSIEPDSMKGEMLQDLEGYNLIFARETITYNALKNKGLSNVRLCPDPAFLLAPQETDLPKGFEEGNTIGINLSPMIMSYEKDDGMAFKNYEKLIDHLLKNNSYKIALIPHVMWDHNDDRIPLKRLYAKYKDTGRVIFIAEDNKLNASELKYIISKCKIFIAARTHSSIAAYSQCVPTLVVGYSVKARGIALDLFGKEEEYVLPVQKLHKEDNLTKAFISFESKENSIREKLEALMPKYKSRILEIVKEINTLQSTS